MKTFKAKSLTPELTDFEIETGTHIVQFISFESAIQLLSKISSCRDRPHHAGHRP